MTLQVVLRRTDRDDESGSEVVHAKFMIGADGERTKHHFERVEFQSMNRRSFMGQESTQHRDGRRANRVHLGCCRLDTRYQFP